MAIEQVVEGLQIARDAGADLTGKLFYLAKLDSAGKFVLAAAETDGVVGVIREANIANKPVTVQFGGIGKVLAGAAISAGDLLTSNANGEAIPTTTTGHRIIGRALADAADASIASVFLHPGVL